MQHIAKLAQGQSFTELYARIGRTDKLNPTTFKEAVYRMVEDAAEVELNNSGLMNSRIGKLIAELSRIPEHASNQPNVDLLARGLIKYLIRMDILLSKLKKTLGKDSIPAQDIRNNFHPFILDFPV